MMKNLGSEPEPFTLHISWLGPSLSRGRSGVPFVAGSLVTPLHSLHVRISPLFPSSSVIRPPAAGEPGEMTGGWGKEWI